MENNALFASIVLQIEDTPWNTPIHTHRHTHTHTHTLSLSLSPPRPHTHPPTHKHTHILTHTPTPPHTHTHTLSLSHPPPPPPPPHTRLAVAVNHANISSRDWQWLKRAHAALIHCLISIIALAVIFTHLQAMQFAIHFLQKCCIFTQVSAILHSSAHLALIRCLWRRADLFTDLLKQNSLQ